MSTAQRNMPIRSSRGSSRRKYLGDPEDPHFIPTSPIISRQALSPEQEEELVRSCTYVLSGVPHSDNDEDDPSIKHVTTRVTVKATRVHQEREKPAFTKYASGVGAGIEYNYKLQKLRHIGEDTATPSVVSKRDTLDRTDTSTPLTILSENLRRSSSTQQNIGWRTESKPSKSHTVAEAPGNPYNMDMQGKKRVMAESMTLLPISGTRLQQSLPATSSGTNKRGNFSISHVEFNKSLPSLPRVDEFETVEKHSAGLLRFLKSIQKKKVDSITSTGQHLEQQHIQRAHTAPIALPARKDKFKFASLFERKKRQQPAQVLV